MAKQEKSIEAAAKSTATTAATGDPDLRAKELSASKSTMELRDIHHELGCIRCEIHIAALAAEEGDAMQITLKRIAERLGDAEERLEWVNSGLERPAKVEPPSASANASSSKAERS